jgi:hypothetical protein
MRGSIIAALLVLASVCCDRGLAQATFQFRNYVRSISGSAFDKPVFDASGNRLFGTNYVAMLYGGPIADSLVPAVDLSTFQTAAPVPFTYAPDGQTGYFLYEGPLPGDHYVAIPSIPPAGGGWLQVRAWDLRVAATYEEAEAMGVGGYGQSTVFFGVGGTGPVPNPTPPSLLFGMESFTLVPEPAPWLLLSLFLLGLVAFRRERIRVSGFGARGRRLCRLQSCWWNQ